MIFTRTYQVNEVFGISTDILENSYIDRGELDAEIKKHLGRNHHIALRGESKCGKSWLRKKNIPNALVVQCRLGKKVHDIYTDALSQLGIKLVIESKSSSSIKGSVEGSSEVGSALLVKLGLKAKSEVSASEEKIGVNVGGDITDLRFIAEIINNSGRKLVIEDFHYLSPEERATFAFDLKAFWDYKTYLVVIGVWADNNLLLHLNPDLAARVHELSIFWSKKDLQAVIDKGSDYLNISFSDEVKRELVGNSFETVGILQSLLVGYLDECNILATQKPIRSLNDLKALEAAALAYADQLNAVYQTMAGRVSKGIRTRTKSTGIYAHMLAVILNASDSTLSSGLHLNSVFSEAHKRESRIQKGNLRTVLEKLDSLQADEHGRGLVFTYDTFSEIVSVVDKQILLYRRYATVKWPWEDLLLSSTGYEGE